MIKKKNFFTKKILIYLLFVSTLLLGFYIKEDPGGGGKIDFTILFPYIKNFSINLREGFNLFFERTGIIAHSPFFYVILSFLLKFSDNQLFLSILYIFISSTLPFIFFLILKKKFDINHNYLFYFSLIIFFSPYFRSSAIWLLGDNLSLIFFSIAVLFYLNTKKNEKIIYNYYLCLFFLILCAYIRYYYCVYSIFFIINFYRKLDKLNFIKILFFCFLLSIPAFLYVFYVIQNHNFLFAVSNFGSLNIYTNVLIVLSILIFYLFPFILSEIPSIYSYFKKNLKFIYAIFIIIIFIYFLDINTDLELITFSPRGGGVFVKLINLFNVDLKLFMSLIAILSLIILDFLFQKKRIQNYFLIIIVIFSLPLFTFYQKYLDPLFFIIMFGLIKSDIIEKLFINKKLNLLFSTTYFFCFYIFSLIYHIKVV